MSPEEWQNFLLQWQERDTQRIPPPPSSSSSSLPSLPPVPPVPPFSTNTASSSVVVGVKCEEEEPGGGGGGVSSCSVMEDDDDAQVILDRILTSTHIKVEEEVEVEEGRSHHPVSTEPSVSSRQQQQQQSLSPNSGGSGNSDTDDANMMMMNMMHVMTTMMNQEHGNNTMTNSAGTGYSAGNSSSNFSTITPLSSPLPGFMSPGTASLLLFNTMGNNNNRSQPSTPLRTPLPLPSISATTMPIGGSGGQGGQGGGGVDPFSVPTMMSTSTAAHNAIYSSSLPVGGSGVGGQSRHLNDFTFFGGSDGDGDGNNINSNNHAFAEDTVFGGGVDSDMVDVEAAATAEVQPLHRILPPAPLPSFTGAGMTSTTPTRPNSNSYYNRSAHHNLHSHHHHNHHGHHGHHGGHNRSISFDVGMFSAQQQQQQQQPLLPPSELDPEQLQLPWALQGNRFLSRK